jgi:succinate dehydrogenase (ubiquinone) membrane anchor subunit
LSPSKLNMPVDLALGVALPLHAHIGMNYVITDYATKLLGAGARGPARICMAGFTGVTMVGLLKLNLSGPGITETVKSLWYTKKA